MNSPTKAAFIVRAKALQEIDQHENRPMTVEGEARELNKRYVRVSLEAHSDKFDCYLGIPVELFDDNVKIGDEYILSFTKK